MANSAEAVQTALQLIQTTKAIADVQSTIASTQRTTAETQDMIAITQKLMASDPKYLGLEKQAGRLLDDMQDNAVASTFHKFVSLPTELRIAIWVMALPAGRIYEVFEDMEEERVSFHRPSCPPKIRSVCKEAWRVTEDNGVWALDYMWFNKYRDIFFLPDVMESTSVFTSSFRDFLPDVRIVAVEAFTTEQELPKSLRECDTLILVFCYGYAGDNRSGRRYHIPRFYELGDDDFIKPHFSAMYLSENQTWKEYRDKKLRDWQAFAAKNGHSVEAVPVIKGVEVLRTVQEDAVEFESRKAR